jgi:hypothetical protein
MFGNCSIPLKYCLPSIVLGIKYVSEYWILDARFWMLDVSRFSILDTEQKNLNMRNCIVDTLHRVSSIQYRVSIFVSPVPAANIYR